MEAKKLIEKTIV